MESMCHVPAALGDGTAAAAAAPLTAAASTTG
jgi:hypothetical protein